MKTLRASIGRSVLVVLCACGGGDNNGDGGDSGPPADTSVMDMKVSDVMDATMSDITDAAPTDADAMSMCDGGIITLTAILPTFGWTGATVAVTITGTGFVATPTAQLVPSMSDGGPDAGVVNLTNIGYIGANSITARVPINTAVGAYDLRVTNPDGCVVTLVNAYTSVQNAPPKIISVQPATGTTMKDTPVVVTGCHFPMNATIATIDVMNMSVAGSVQNVTCSGPNVPECDNTPMCTMNATIKSSMLSAGAYVVRVTNPTDMTWGDWSAFVVTDPSGKLTGGWVAANSLVTGRRSLQAISGRLDDANRFLYAVGGEDMSGTALSTVEVAQVDSFGRLGVWFVQKYKLNAARSGLTVARQGRYLWAFGGTSSVDGTKGTTPSGTALPSIERAKILDPAGAPKLADPTTLMAGNLMKGTWYYRVSAVLTNADPDNPSGETLASDEKIVPLANTGSVSLSWGSVANASYYRVYRSPMANGKSGSEVLLKDNIMATAYSDDGTAMAGMEKPLLLGSTGVWITVNTVLAAPVLDRKSTRLNSSHRL